MLKPHSQKKIIKFSRGLFTNNFKLREVNVIAQGKQNACPKQTTGHENEKPSEWYNAKPFSQIPGPKPLPIIGNVWRFLPLGDFYKMDFVDMHKKFYKEYGDITLVSGIGRQMVILFNPNDIELLHRNEGSAPVRIGLPSITYYRTIQRKDIFKGYGGLLTVQGKDWLDARSKVNPSLLQPRVVAKYIPHVDNVASDLVARMEYLASKNEGEMPENFFDDLLTWSFEGIAGIAMDRNFGFLKMNKSPNPEAQTLIDSVLQMNKLTLQLDVLPSAWRYIATPAWRRYVKVMDNITNITFKYLEESLKNIEGKEENDLSAIQKISKIDMKLAVATSMDLIIGGIDTTSRSLGAALYYLAKNKDKQTILRNELINLLPTKDTPLTQKILQEAAYLRAVIKETTRIAGAAVGTTRTTVKDLVLSGYQIPKGTEVITSNLVLSTVDKHFPRSQEFLPERWLRSTNDELSYKNTHPFVFLPFGFGPRSCAGKRLANLELEVAVAKIIRNFELSWDHKDMTFSMILLYGIKDPLKLKIKPLES